MTEKNRIDGTLISYRVLELTGERGFFCGKLLADLGADVIKIERPGGTQTRQSQTIVAWIYAEGMANDYLKNFDWSKYDLIHNLELSARGYWVEVEHPEFNTHVTYPGAFAKATEAGPILICRAFLIGEHNLGNL